MLGAVLVSIGAATFTVAAAAPAQAEDASGCQHPPAKQALDTRGPVNIDLLADQLVVYRCTDYLSDVAAVLARARTWVEQRAGQVDNPAVVLDIDETSLSNWEAIYHNHFAFAATGPCDLSAAGTLCGQRDWDLSARAVALQPTLEFYRHVKGLKGRNGPGLAIFFVTGRVEDPSERVATQWNLRKEGYDTWQKLSMRPPSSSGWVSIYKSDERKQIEEHYRIIANIGDQYSDLIGDTGGDHAERCFKVPDPFYFIPPGLPEGGLACLKE